MNTERLSKCFLSQAPVWFYSTICAKEPGKASMPLIPSTLAHSIKRKRHCSIGGVHLLNPTGVATLFSVFLPNSAQNKHKIFLDKKASGSHIRFPITLSRNMPALQLPSIVLGILHIHSNTLTFLKGTWTAPITTNLQNPVIEVHTAQLCVSRGGKWGGSFARSKIQKHLPRKGTK